jgi:hypothetical protein
MVIIGIKKYKTKDGKEKIKAFLADVSSDGGFEPCGTAAVRSVSDLPDGKFPMGCDVSIRQYNGVYYPVILSIYKI